MPKMIIGITGTIASGKSVVSDYLRNKGFYVFDCDKYNSFLLEEGNIGYSLIYHKYPNVFDDGILNKKRLSSLIFNDKYIKKDVESLLHPLIINKMFEESKNFDIYFAEVPLLFEANLDKYFDEKLLIVTSFDNSVSRLIEKGYSKEEAILRIKNQMSVEEKKKRATKIIYNCNSLPFLYNEIDKYLKELNVR